MLYLASYHLLNTGDNPLPSCTGVGLLNFLQWGVLSAGLEGRHTNSFGSQGAVATTPACFLELHCTGAPANNKTYPVVLFMFPLGPDPA